MRRNQILGGLLAALALAALYLAAANWLLAGDWVRSRVNRRPERMLVTWSSAWTPFPGVVRLRDLRVRGNHRSVQWEATAAEAWATIDLPVLAARVFRVSGLRATGVAFRLRRRLAGRPGAAATAALLPPIAGLDAAGEPPAPSPRPPPVRHGWTLDFADVDLRELREIWIEGAHWRGAAAARGGFRIRLGRDTEVRPSRLELRSGTLETGGIPSARGLQGTLRARIARFAHPGHGGWAVLRSTSGAADLRGVLLDLRSLEPYLAQAPWLTLRGGVGGFTAHAVLDHGTLAPGSGVHLAERPLEARFFDYRAEGRGALDWRVAADPEPHGELRADLGGFALLRDGATAPHLRGDHLTLAASTRDLVVDGTLHDLAVTLDMPRAEIPRLAFYDDYLPRGIGLSLLGGSGRMRGRFTSDGAGGRAEIALHGDDVRARFRDVEMAGDLDLTSRLATDDLRRRDFDAGGTTLVLRDVTVRDPGDARPAAGVAPWSATVRLERAQLAPGQPVFLDAELAADARDSRPLVALFAARRPLPGWLRGLLAVEGVHARGRVQAGEGLLVLDPFAVTGESLELRTRLRLRPEPRGALLATWRDLSLGVELRGGGRDLHLVKARAWFDAYAPR